RLRRRDRARAETRSLPDAPRPPRAPDSRLSARGGRGREARGHGVAGSDQQQHEGLLRRASPRGPVPLRRGDARARGPRDVRPARNWVARGRAAGPRAWLSRGPRTADPGAGLPPAEPARRAARCRTARRSAAHVPGAGTRSRQPGTFLRCTLASRAMGTRAKGGAAVSAGRRSAGITTSLEVRERLVEALRLDLVGPGPGHPFGEERRPGWVRPSNWYLTGFLIPSGSPPAKSADADEDDDFELVPESAGLSEESSEERKAAKKGYFPSSMGLSFLVPEAARALDVAVRWGDYAPAEMEGEDGKPVSVWQRTPREVRVSLALQGAFEQVVRDVPGSGGLQLHLVERPIAGKELAGLIPARTRSVSVFLVNRRTPDEENPDRAYAFQAEIEVRGGHPFVPRPDPRGALAEEWAEQVADLHYADTPEYAAGHGVSAAWEVDDGVCRVLRTAWIPEAEVEKTTTVDVPGVELSIEALGAVANGAAATAALSPPVAQYRAWIEEQRRAIASLRGKRRETADELLRLASVAADRIERGMAVLGQDADALDAFRVANLAVARAMRQRRRFQGLPDEVPRWRAFQLAFLLLNLPGLADPRHPDRHTVDLLFFPTGAGKTEAYLALAAFAMVLRRLRHPGEKGLAGAGVSVIMRYTLRLLTLDQLARAAGLVCALELERERDPARYGEWP